MVHVRIYRIHIYVLYIVSRGVCVYICTHTCVYIHIVYHNIYEYICIHTYVYAQRQIHTHVFILKYITWSPRNDRKYFLKIFSSSPTPSPKAGSCYQILRYALSSANYRQCISCGWNLRAAVTQSLDYAVLFYYGE